MRSILSAAAWRTPGAIGGAAVAAGTAATVMIVHRARRRAVPATS